MSRLRARRYGTTALSEDNLRTVAHCEHMVVVFELQRADDIELSLSRIDVGLGRAVVAGQGVRRNVLRHEALLAVIPSSGAGKKVLAEIDVAALDRCPLIRYAPQASHGFAGHLLSIFRDKRLTPTRIIEVREMQTALVIMAAGAGAILIPALARRLVHPDAVCLPVTPAVTTPIVLSRRTGDASRKVAVLLQTIKDLYPEWDYAVPDNPFLPITP